MSKKEISRVWIIEKFIKKEISRKTAAKKIWVSPRQVSRLKTAYIANWAEWLIHWLRGEKWNRPSKLTPQVKAILNDELYEWCKPTFMSEKLEERHGIKLSWESVRTYMIKEKLREWRTRKKHKYRRKRKRRSYYWELVQYDWSYHKRIPWLDEEFCMHVAVDDATGITTARLTHNESYEAVSTFWIAYIKKHWIPKQIYLDKFSTYKINHPKASQDKKLKTDFDTAMSELWCELIFAHSPQAKWRVEKKNHTLQERFVKELQIRKIKTLKEANIYLIETFLPAFNEKFGVPAQKEWDVHIEREYTIEELNEEFARKRIRSLWRDYIVQYKNRFYQVEENEWVRLYPKQKITVLELRTWEIKLKANWKTLAYEKLNARKVKSNRAKYWSDLWKVKQEKSKMLLEEREQNRHIASKKRQAKYRAQRLIEKSKTYKKEAN